MNARDIEALRRRIAHLALTEDDDEIAELCFRAMQSPLFPDDESAQDEIERVVTKVQATIHRDSYPALQVDDLLDPLRRAEKATRMNWGPLSKIKFLRYGREPTLVDELCEELRAEILRATIGPLPTIPRVYRVDDIARRFRCDDRVAFEALSQLKWAGLLKQGSESPFSDFSEWTIKDLCGLLPTAFASRLLHELAPLLSLATTPSEIDTRLLRESSERQQGLVGLEFCDEDVWSHVLWLTAGGMCDGQVDAVVTAFHRINLLRRPFGEEKWCRTAAAEHKEFVHLADEANQEKGGSRRDKCAEAARYLCLNHFVGKNSARDRTVGSGTSNHDRVNRSADHGGWWKGVAPSLEGLQELGNYLEEEAEAAIERWIACRDRMLKLSA